MKSWMKLAVTGLACLVGLGGCATTPGHLASAGTSAARAVHRAEPTIGAIERAVVQAPSSTDDRVRLGRSYLAAGRFASAETAFGDALTLDPSLGRVMVLRALTQIAQGHDADARVSLDTARGRAPESDVALALALAGQRTQAIGLLEGVVRQSGGDAHVRQNLALIYGLEGRWTDAATMAARDVPADQIGGRLGRWARIVQRGPRAADQLFAILGVTPATDPGQPSSLALIVPAKAMPIPVRLSVAPIPALTLQTPPIAMPTVATPRPATPMARKATLVKSADTGRFVVQLGAYRSASRLEAAWSRLSAHARYLSTYAPARSSLKAATGSAVMHRLALGGFGTRAEAQRLCARIKANDGDCFVRTTAGDSPMIWASEDQRSDARG